MVKSSSMDKWLRKHNDAQLDRVKIGTCGSKGNVFMSTSDLPDKADITCSSHTTSHAYKDIKLAAPLSDLGEGNRRPPLKTIRRAVHSWLMTRRDMHAEEMDVAADDGADIAKDDQGDAKDDAEEDADDDAKGGAKDQALVPQTVTIQAGSTNDTSDEGYNVLVVWVPRFRGSRLFSRMTAAGLMHFGLNLLRLTNAVSINFTPLVRAWQQGDGIAFARLLEPLFLSCWNESWAQDFFGRPVATVLGALLLADTSIRQFQQVYRHFVDLPLTIPPLDPVGSQRKKDLERAVERRILLRNRAVPVHLKCRDRATS